MLLEAEGKRGLGEETRGALGATVKPVADPLHSTEKIPRKWLSTKNPGRSRTSPTKSIHKLWQPRQPALQKKWKPQAQLP